MTGNEARRRESKAERERFGERGRATLRRGLISAVGLNQQHLRIS